MQTRSVARIDAEALATANDHLPIRRAIINGALGRLNRMFDGLDAMAEREPRRLPRLLRSARLVGYRRDPHFRQLVQRLRLDGDHGNVNHRAAACL